jgi:hypothetical protein
MTRLATFDTPLHTTADAGVFTYEWATSNAGGTQWDRYDATHWDHADATHWDHAGGTQWDRYDATHWDHAGGTQWDRYDATHWDHADATHWDLRTIPSTDPVELRIGALAAA